MANHLERIGQQVGDYRLLRWLGGGGFGNVYLAEQVRDNFRVAIKLLHIRLSHREELKAFINEARTIRLKHVHIVPLLDFGISQEEVPFLVMEYIAQGTLRDWYPQGSRLPLTQVVNYAQQVATALQYAHEQHLVHRDVKPENMLLRVDGTVLLSDFGVVVAHSSPSLSLHQEIGGTTAYMAPEQIRGKAKAASDQYSLGVVVYEWITGRRPFEGTAAEVAVQHALKPPPSLVAQVSGLSRAVEEVVLKALAKDPRDRFVTVRDFAAALEQTVGLAPPLSDEYDTSPIEDDRQLSLSNTSISPVSSLNPSTKPVPRVDWGDALVVPTFYGREQEQDLLTQWVVQERCRVVSVLGMGGIGKSALVISMTYRLAEHFEVVIVRSLRDAPSCEALLDDCLQVLSPQSLGQAQGLPVSATLEQRISLLLSHLRKARVLMVLDNLESLLEAGDIRGHFRPGFEGYGHLLHRVAETAHQSCLLLTSREKPAELSLLVGKYSSVRTLRLGGLGAAACKQLLVEKGVALGFTSGFGTEEDAAQLIEVYAGNPLALKIVAETIVDLFGGEIGPFLAGGMVIFGGITDLLDEQFARLSALEQSVLFWLAIMREPVTLDELLALLVSPVSSVQVLEAVDAGYRHSLIESGKRPGSFTLQSVVLEYVTKVLIAEATSEILQGRLDRLIQHGLEQATAREYVRQTQERLLVSALLADLQSAYWGQDVAGQAQGTVPMAPVEVQLRSLLEQLREKADNAQGYGPANLIALLRLLRGHLNAWDFSKLSIRGAYLQSIEMQDASLVGSQISDCVWTSAVSATWAVAISLDGKWWAAGSMEGRVRVWNRVRSQTLHLIWQAHTDEVETLAFSPDGRTLASGSVDGTLKLWDVGSGTLLWTAWENSSQSLAFSPDSSLLASGGHDATVRLWDLQSGKNVQTLRHSGSVFAVAFSPDGSLLASGCSHGELRLWERRETVPATCVEVLRLETHWVTGLAFAPDGSTLASAHWQQTIKLWEVGSHGAGPRGRLLHTLPRRTDQGKRIAWSPDGHTLASCSHKAIWLWDVEQRRYRAVLVGHTAYVHDMAFTPDSSSLLSSSADGTLRVWDIQSRQCVRVIAGYAVSLYDLDWSPNGTHLVSGGTDGLVTIWDLSGGTPPRVLHGHTWVVCGVGWSPDGRFLASCGWDVAVRLWDPTSGVCIQMFQDFSTTLEGMAWSPDGRLLAGGTYQRGMQVWDVTARSLLWVEQTHLISFRRVAWSPDGMRLVGGGADGSLYLWEGVDGTGQAQAGRDRRDDPLRSSVPLRVPTRLPAHQGKVMSVAWSPDGARLASGGGSGGRGELFVWDVSTGECVQTFAGHPGVVSALAWGRGQTDTVGTGLVPVRAPTPTSPYGPSGGWLVSGGSDGMLRWWDIQSGECVMMQEAHQGTIQSLKVSPDGKWLASCGDDGAIRIWDLQSSEHLRMLRRDRPYERLNITGIRGLTEAQKATLQALGAIEEGAP